MPQDYVASFSEAKGSQILHFGVPGMKWGQRKSESTSTKTISGTTGVPQHGLTNRISVKDPKSRKDAVAEYGKILKAMPPGGMVGMDVKSVVALHNAGRVLNRTSESPKIALNKQLVKDLDDFHHQVETVKHVVAVAQAAGSKDVMVRFNDRSVRDYLVHGMITEARAKGNLELQDGQAQQSSVDTESDLVHYGVPGMKWGQRKAKDHGPGTKGFHKAEISKIKKMNTEISKGKLPSKTGTPDHVRIAANKQHIEGHKAAIANSSTSNVKREGIGFKRGLVTDATLSPYRSVGRIRRGKTTFDQLTPKQQNKLHKSLARDLGKTLEKKLNRKARGKIDYLSTVKANPHLRDSLITKHGSLFRFGKRDVGNENKRQYLTTFSNYPRVLTMGSKTNSAVSTLGLSAILSKAFSKHSDDIAPNDYIGVVTGKELEHFGVPGMKWGVRNSRSSGGGGATPTRARAKEVAAAARAKEGNKLTERAEKIKSGTGRPLVLNGKVLSRDQSVKHLERQAEKLGVKTKKAPEKKADADELKKHANEDAAKYAALKAKAKEKGPASLTDEELKFVNSRTQALTKTQELFAKKDSLLKRAVKNAMDRALNESLKLVTDAGNKKLKDFIDLKTAAKPSPSSGSSKTKTPNGTYSILFGRPGSKPKPGPFGGPYRTTATQAGPGWPTSQGFANKPLGRAPLALPPGPVYKVTTL